jgi:HAD superfamily hydrolase (TIGR01509 family)
VAIETAIKAVVFDFDGLIVDTESAWYDALAEIFRDHGVYLPLEKWAQCVGTSHDLFDPYDYLGELLGKPIDRVALQQLAASKHSVIMENRQIRPGVESYLQAAQQRGLKIGLASSSERSWVERFLRHYGLIHYFQCIRTADDVAQVKPNPELYLQATAGLGVSPVNAVAFEDSPNGAKAAKAAGLRCVIVPNPITATLTFGDYDLRLNSMADMEFAEVFKLVE